VNCELNCGGGGGAAFTWPRKKDTAGDKTTRQISFGDSDTHVTLTLHGRRVDPSSTSKVRASPARFRKKRASPALR
jgi:hypothetical protein